jgi:RNA polymerase sigma factor (TIGR02999 family)
MTTQCEQSQRPAPPNPDGIARILDEFSRRGINEYEELIKVVAASLRATAELSLKSAHTVHPVTLVYDTWGKLTEADPVTASAHYADFFTAAAEAIRRILVESAERKFRRRFGTAAADQTGITLPLSNYSDLIPISEALDTLATQDPRKAELVKLRYFAGLTIEDAAEVLEISVSTATNDWAYARAWLCAKVTRGVRARPVQEVLISNDGAERFGNETWTRDQTGSWRDETWTR